MHILIMFQNLASFPVEDDENAVEKVDPEKVRTSYEKQF